jgi:hypothetical protein
MFSEVVKNAERQQVLFEDVFKSKGSKRIEDYYPELHTTVTSLQ